MKTLADPEPWTNTATGYVGWSHCQLSLDAQDAIRLLAPNPTSTVLDVGCGSGQPPGPIAPRRLSPAVRSPDLSRASCQGRAVSIIEVYRWVSSDRRFRSVNSPSSQGRAVDLRTPVRTPSARTTRSRSSRD